MSISYNAARVGNQMNHMSAQYSCSKSIEFYSFLPSLKGK
jgi:hypothetical protein